MAPKEMERRQESTTGVSLQAREDLQLLSCCKDNDFVGILEGAEGKESCPKKGVWQLTLASPELLGCPWEPC